MLNLDKKTAWIEARVKAMFDEMFPPGSDGPGAGFRIGSLYEAAELEWHATVRGALEELRAAILDVTGIAYEQLVTALNALAGRIDVEAIREQLAPLIAQIGALEAAIDGQRQRQYERCRLDVVRKRQAARRNRARVVRDQRGYPVRQINRRHGEDRRTERNGG